MARVATERRQKTKTIVVAVARRSGEEEEALQTAAARANRGQYKQENRAGANRKRQGMSGRERE